MNVLQFLTSNAYDGDVASLWQNCSEHFGHTQSISRRVWSSRAVHTYHSHGIKFLLSCSFICNAPVLTQTTLMGAILWHFKHCWHFSNTMYLERSCFRSCTTFRSISENENRYFFNSSALRSVRRLWSLHWCTSVSSLEEFQSILWKWSSGKILYSVKKSRCNGNIMSVWIPIYDPQSVMRGYWGWWMRYQMNFPFPGCGWNSADCESSACATQSYCVRDV